MSRDLPLEGQAEEPEELPGLFLNAGDQVLVAQDIDVLLPREVLLHDNAIPGPPDQAGGLKRGQVRAVDFLEPPEHLPADPLLEPTAPGPAGADDPERPIGVLEPPDGGVSGIQVVAIDPQVFPLG